MIELNPSLPLGSARDQRARLAEAAKHFEAIFARQMLSAARQARFGDDLLGSAGGDTFRQMMDDHFAELLADSGTLGVARAIEAQLAAHIGPKAEG